MPHDGAFGGVQALRRAVERSQREVCRGPRDRLQDGKLTHEGIARYVATQPTTFPGLIQIVGDLSIFIRGDSNLDSTVNISDPLNTLGYLFAGDGSLACADAADANDDGRVDISDPIATLEHLFVGSGFLPPPTRSPGIDPTPDGLGCEGP
jgi:hypothetical protein